MELIRRNVLRSARCVRALGRRASSSAAAATDGNDAASGGVGVGGGGAGGDGGQRLGRWERRVVSGLQPTGALHVGNYFGALRRCVRAQDDGDQLTLFVADLHALTTQHELGLTAAQLQERSLELTALALGAGVDPARSVLFAQSAVPRHAELCWLLACLCSQARVYHLPQYKEKASRVARGGGIGDGSEVGLGLLLYPVLQAADVLLHRGTHVPVGADQQQHVQLAAMLAKTFHHRYGEAFPVPRAMLPSDGSDRIRSLRDPTRKMSKSDRDRRAAILLTDDDDVISDKIRKAVTDCRADVSFEPESRPGVATLLTLHCLAADKLPEEVVEEVAGYTTAQYKKEVAASLCAALRPVRERASCWRARPRALRDVLAAGAARARAQADETYEHVTRLVGLAPTRDASEPAMHAVKLPVGNESKKEKRELAAR